MKQQQVYPMRCIYNNEAPWPRGYGVLLTGWRAGKEGSASPYLPARRCPPSGAEGKEGKGSAAYPEDAGGGAGPGSAPPLLAVPQTPGGSEGRGSWAGRSGTALPSETASERLGEPGRAIRCRRTARAGSG